MSAVVMTVYVVQAFRTPQFSGVLTTPLSHVMHSQTIFVSFLLHSFAHDSSRSPRNALWLSAQMTSSSTQLIGLSKQNFSDVELLLSTLCPRNSNPLRPQTTSEYRGPRAFLVCWDIARRNISSPSHFQSHTFTCDVFITAAGSAVRRVHDCGR
eukprot:2950301-Pleurochrysis_carterae.AAC.8